MPDITLIGHDGRQYEIAAEAGRSLMQVARIHDIPGIEGECGGACACATCHVFVDAAWVPTVGVARGDELSLIEFLDDSDETSRLSCQIEVTEGMDGLVIRIPASQL